MNDLSNGGPRVDDIRASIEGRRRDIAETVSEIERRLRPERLRHMAEERFYEITAAWREDPVGQVQAWGRDSLTRLREMAWMNPVGLGLGAFVAGWLVGRRRRSR